MQNQHTCHIRFIGFSSVEKAPFLSVFALSRHRPILYQETAETGQADLSMINTDNSLVMKALQTGASGPARKVFLGEARPDDAQSLWLRKPVRWSELCDRLDRYISGMPEVPQRQSA